MSVLLPYRQELASPVYLVPGEDLPQASDQLRFARAGDAVEPEHEDLFIGGPALDDEPPDGPEDTPMVGSADSSCALDGRDGHYIVLAELAQRVDWLLMHRLLLLYLDD